MSELIKGLLLGIFVSAITYILIELVKTWFAKRKRLINEINYITTLLHEINRGIKRSEYYLKLGVEGKISLSRIYTFSYEKTLPELIRICSNPKIIDKFNYIYSIFSYVNFNIDKSKEMNGVSFLSDHLIEICKTNDRLVNILESKKVNFVYFIFNLRKYELKVSEYRYDKYADIIKKFKEKDMKPMSNKKMRIVDCVLIEEILDK